MQKSGPGRVLSTVFGTIPSAGPPSLIKFHLIDNKIDNKIHPFMAWRVHNRSAMSFGVLYRTFLPTKWHVLRIFAIYSFLVNWEMVNSWGILGKQLVASSDSNFLQQYHMWPSCLVIANRFWSTPSRFRWAKYMDTLITWILANTAWILPKNLLDILYHKLW